MIKYIREVWLPVPPQEVFNYSTTIEGFRKQFPFKVKWHDGPERWHANDVLDFSYRVAGVWMRHRAHVVEWRPGQCFVDEMTHGLYKYFRHTHEFIPDRHGTRVRDQVEFSLGFGKFIDKLIGLPTLANTFKKRHAALAAHFGAGGKP